MIPLTLKEFALAVGADAKWVQNAKPRLSRSIAYTSSDARWLRLTRTLNRDLRIPLAFASELAHAALEQPVSPGDSGAESQVDRSGGRAGRDGSDTARRSRTANRTRPARSVVCVIASKSDGVRLTVDLRRERSTFNAALAAAFAFGEARRPGRKRRAPTHYRAALGRAWKLGVNVGTLRFRARRAAGARLKQPASDRADPSARMSHDLQTHQPMAEILDASLAELGPATEGIAPEGVATDGIVPDGGADGGGAADDMEVTGEHEVPFDSESAWLGRRTRLAAEVLGPPRWRADLSAEIQLLEAEARRSLLRRFVGAGVRFVVVGDLAEALAGATPASEPEPARKAGAGGVRGQVERGSAGELRARPVLDLCYASTGANMRRMANALRELRPRLEQPHREGSGTSPDESPPFAADPITLRSSTALAFRTSFGTIHVRRHIAGIGGFDDVRRRATRVRTFGLELAVLDLPALAHVRAATGTRGDIVRLPTLETLLALPALEARHRELAAKRTSWIDN